MGQTINDTADVSMLALQVIVNGNQAGHIAVEPGATVTFQVVELPPDPMTLPCACGSEKTLAECHGKEEAE